MNIKKESYFCDSIIAMADTRFLGKKYVELLPEGSVSWQAPSNIALIKYWGKYQTQLPQNSSLSFTLKNCHTRTTLFYKPKVSKGYKFEVYRDGKREESFEPKIAIFFERISPYLTFLEAYTFRIETANSFPHSSGIASSASGMSALALCLMHLEKKLNPAIDTTFFNEKASFLARLGSGSAARSIEGPMVVWGEHSKIPKSNNLTGISYSLEVHSVFKNYQDTILLVDKGEKQVSSTLGHQLMHNHPFATQRFKQAEENLSKLIPVLKNGNLNAFIQIVELEALSLHAMMLTSTPYFILMKPNTLEIINQIWEYREKTDSKVCFTLDAGANVHLLYPQNEYEEVQKFIDEKLKHFCIHKEFINDEVSDGAFQL